MNVPRITWKMVQEAAVKYDGRLTNPGKVADIGRTILEGEAVEHFCVVYLTCQHEIQAVEVVCRGILDACLVHPREVFRGAILANAGGVILFHNHPSGDPHPSLEDRQVTKKIREAGEIVGIPLIDHVIIGRDDFYSFAEKGGVL